MKRTLSLPPTLRNPLGCSPSPSLGSLNKRVSGLGFQPSPKSPSATSDTRQPLHVKKGKKGDK